MKQLFICFLITIITTSATPPDSSILKEWRAGQTVTTEAITAYGGVDKCFVSEPIPDTIWEQMQGKSYKANPYIGRDDLRYLRLLHWDYDRRPHLGEMVCNKAIANKLLYIFRKLYDNHYPIERMVLPDVYDANDEQQMRANNTSCFCYRSVAKSSQLSKHAQGLAVDINTRYNPYIKKRRDGSLHVQPSTSAVFCDRSRSFRYKITKGDLCYRLFKEQGFTWGGEWRTCKDYQHFELRNEK